MDNNKIIWAFWEPKKNIPPYLKLCMATWKKFLPDYKIVILDYTNVDEYLDPKLFDKKYLYKNFILAKQADCIRCALLEKYGGVWFDLDTVVTSEKIYDFLNFDSECTMIGRRIGFIVAKKHAKILRKWLKGIKRNLFLHKLCKRYVRVKSVIGYFNPDFIQNIDRWDFCGNRILDPLVNKSSQKEFHSINKIESNTLPEYAKFSCRPHDAYVEYYFNNDFTKETMENTQGLIYLHNSWTPNEYRKMSVSEFLNCKNTLSGILKSILTPEEIMSCEENND